MLEKSTNWKEYLGDQYVGLIEDNLATLPPGAYVRADHRLVKKDRGRFVCEPNSEGMHGDTFDAGKLAAHALTSSSGTFAFERIHLPGRMGWQKGVIA